MKQLIAEFIKDITQFAKEHKISDFELESDYDVEMDVYFLKHNDAEVEMNAEFDEYIVEKMNEYFISKQITNICIYYDCEFAEEVFKKRSSINQIIEKAIGILVEEEKEISKILSQNKKDDIYISSSQCVYEVSDLLGQLHFEKQRSLRHSNIKIPLPKKNFGNNKEYILESNQKGMDFVCSNFYNINQLEAAA